MPSFDINKLYSVSSTKYSFSNKYSPFFSMSNTGKKNNTSILVWLFFLIIFTLVVVVILHYAKVITIPFLNKKDEKD